MKVNKLLSSVLTIFLSGTLLLTGCSEQQAPSYKVGDTVESDIMRLTLDVAEPAVALGNSGAAAFGPGSDGLAKEGFFYAEGVRSRGGQGQSP